MLRVTPPAGFEPRGLALLVGALWATMLLPAAQAQDHSHDAAETDAQLPFGPLISSVSPGGFAINIGTSDGSPRAARLLVWPAASRPGPQTPPLREVAEKPSAWHLLRVDGLAAAQRYRYQVHLDGYRVQNGEVSTAPPNDSARPLTIAVFGDERGEVSGVSANARAIVQSVLAEGPDFVVGTGDPVMRGGQHQDWRQLMRSHGPLLAQVPYFPALGNHELLGDPQAQNFRLLFPAAARRYYAVRYGAVLVLILDANRPGQAEQTQFLDAELRAAQSDPTVHVRLVAMHQPPLSASSHCGVGRYMADWLALFERYRVDAVLGGHDHTYQRLERNGVAYFVSGGGGAPLYEKASCADIDHQALQRYEAVHHYLTLRITPGAGGKDRVTVLARSPQGPPFDVVTLPLPRAPTAALEPVRLAPGQHPPHRIRARWLIDAWYGHRVPMVSILALIVGAIAGSWQFRRRRKRARKRARHPAP